MTLNPDYGLRLKTDGYRSAHTEHFFHGISIPGFDALGLPGEYTVTVDTMYAGEPHCLSLDFGPRTLTKLLDELPTNIRDSIKTQLKRNPHTPAQFVFPRPVRCETVKATLGARQQGAHDRFIPLIVQGIEVVPRDSGP